jgi:hypothetical protein
MSAVAFATGTALLFCHSMPVGADAHSPQSVLDRFLAASARRTAVPYRAVRRLEASSTKLKATGWIEVLTEFDLQTGLGVRILNEGGAGRIRGALKGVLDGEREATLPGKRSAAALTADNYAFAAGPVDAGGVVALLDAFGRRGAPVRPSRWTAGASGGPLVR